MTEEILKNAPLIEAILEIRWRMTEIQKGIFIDPNYKLLVGRLYDRIEKEYPYHEPLPASSMPDEMFGYVVQHRFRIEKDDWPLVQTGPGIVTLNDTEKYSWSDFSSRSLNLIEALYGAYPNATANLKIQRLQLRYIDAIPFDFDYSNIFEFLKENLKVTVEFPQDILNDCGVTSFPKNLNTLFTFPINKPNGIIQWRLMRGKKKNENALIWETIVESNGDQLSDLPNLFEDWLSSAHTITHNLFFRLIEGKLKERFS